MSMVVVEISDEEMNSLTQSILIRYGIDFTCYEPKSLRRRIIRLLSRLNLNSIHELWLQFLNDSKFVHLFMNEISVGMTSMFRDPILWRKLRAKLSAEFISTSDLSIWHAGCSTGEEVYSMGILISEMQWKGKVKALATDFNRNAIEEAKAGNYHKIKMIENEANHRQLNTFHDFSKYYTTDGTHIVMNRALIAHASFAYHNLITDAYPQGFDIIFCRNVMIYFDTIAKMKILERFHAALNTNGLLIIGFFDTMTHLIDNQKFELVDEQAKIFRKR